MRTNGRKFITMACGGLLAIGVIFWIVGHRSFAQPAKQTSGDRAGDAKQIRKSSANFLSAFKKGDAKAIARMWTATGEYVNDAGETLRGRKEIEEALVKFFKKNKIGSVDQKIDAVRFISEHTAIEEGTMRVIKNDEKTANVTSYSVLHVRENGTWYMAVVREWSGVVINSQLKDLNWMVGSWMAKNKDRTIVMNFAWDENKAFLNGDFVVKEGKKIVSSGKRIIGRDPVDDVVRSWSFLSDGSYGHGVWLKDGDHWRIETGSKLADGSQTWSANIITKLSNDAFTFQSIDRTIDNESIPDTEPVKVVRIKGAK